MTDRAVVDLSEKLRRITETWSPKIVAQVGDTQVKLARIHGTFDWHSHEKEDELFLVLDGRMKLEFRDGEVWLEQGQLYVVPHGVEHRPVLRELEHFLGRADGGDPAVGDGDGAVSDRFGAGLHR